MVYLLCFHQHYKHARHYLGFVENAESLDRRIERHRKGQGARLMQVISKAGIGFEVVRTWADGDRNFERELKNRKNSSKLCPICSKKPSKPKALLIVDTETSAPDGSPLVLTEVVGSIDSYERVENDG